MPKTAQRTALLALIALVLAAALAAPASAKTNVIVGMGEQHTKVFKQSKYKALKIKRVRYVVPTAPRAAVTRVAQRPCRVVVVTGRNSVLAWVVVARG